MCRRDPGKSHFCSDFPYSQAPASLLDGSQTAQFQYCPFDQLKCGSPQRQIISNYAVQQFYTTPLFDADSVCPFHIQAETFIQLDVVIELKLKMIVDSTVLLYSGSTGSNVTTFNRYLLPDTTVRLNIFESHTLVVLPENSTARKIQPFVSFSVQNVAEQNVKDFTITYGKYLLIALLALILVGVCAGSSALRNEIEALDKPSSAEFAKHLKDYVVVGNAWDPEDEMNTRQRLNLGEGGEPEEIKEGMLGGPGGMGGMFELENMDASSYTESKSYTESYARSRTDNHHADMRNTGYSHHGRHSRGRSRGRTREESRGKPRDPRKTESRRDRDEPRNLDEPRDRDRSRSAESRKSFGGRPESGASLRIPSATPAGGMPAYVNPYARREQNRNPLTYTHGQQQAMIVPLD